MDIIQGHNSLRQLLEEIKNKQVTIVTAFATKTEPLIETLLQNGNHLTLVAGTINAFTDPVFIERCRDWAAQKNSHLTFFVDFRGQKSVHWKLYLV